KVAMSTAGEADLVLYLIDACEGLTEADAATLKRIAKVSQAPITIVLSKIDRVKHFEVKKTLSDVSAQIKDLRNQSPEVAAKLPMQIPLTVSAKRSDSI